MLVRKQLCDLNHSQLTTEPPGRERTMMVLYRLPEYLAVKVYNEDKYQSSMPNEYEQEDHDGPISLT